jgi:ketosteroid isomerase-like protein
MSPNKTTVELYMDAFRRTDRARILACLTDDVEWRIPGIFDIRGKDAFNQHIVDEGFTGAPVITVTRLVEEHDVVVAEGTVRTQRTDGTSGMLEFCDVFEMRDGKIRRLISYLMQTDARVPS